MLEQFMTSEGFASQLGTLSPDQYAQALLSAEGFITSGHAVGMTPDEILAGLQGDMDRVLAGDRDFFAEGYDPDALDPFAKSSGKMESAASKMDRAADKMVDAADAMLAAVSPRTPLVDLPSGFGGLSRYETTLTQRQTQGRVVQLRDEAIARSRELFGRRLADRRPRLGEGRIDLETGEVVYDELIEERRAEHDPYYFNPAIDPY